MICRYFASVLLLPNYASTKTCLICLRLVSGARHLQVLVLFQPQFRFSARQDHKSLLIGMLIGLILHSAEYFAGRLNAPPGQSPEPKPCAGTDGTQITVHDLFFNAPQRRKVFKSFSEEYNRALEIASKYAVHYGSRGVGITCRKARAQSLDLNAPSNALETTHDAIRHVYGATLARDLIHLKPMSEADFGFSAEGWLSNGNWVSKKTTFICFINNRLVDCPSLKRSLEGVYALILPKGRHPWIYISLTIDPTRIDVNVHPTKQEVHFLDEEAILEMVTARAHDLLSEHSSCRVYSMKSSPMGRAVSDTTVQVLAPRAPERYDPRHLVRVDHSDQKLDAMLGTCSLPAAGIKSMSASTRVPESACLLTSVAELRADIVLAKHEILSELVQNHTFVGVIDLARGQSLIQHGTQLFMVNHVVLIEEFAYQLALRQFGAFTLVRLDPAPRISELIALGYSMEAGNKQKETLHLVKDEAVERVVRTLQKRADMLLEYFGICIDQNGLLHTMPVLLPSHGAVGLALERLPSLMFRLGPQVHWDDEKQCFHSLCRELAYAHVPFTGENAAWTIQHVWFASMLGARDRFLVPKYLSDQDFIQVASLPDLCTFWYTCN